MSSGASLPIRSCILATSFKGGIPSAILLRWGFVLAISGVGISFLARAIRHTQSGLKLRRSPLHGPHDDICYSLSVSGHLVASTGWMEILPLRAVRIQLVRQFGRNNWSVALVIHNGVCCMGLLTEIFFFRYQPILYCCRKVHKGAFAYRRAFFVNIVLTVVDRACFFHSLPFLCTAQMKKVGGVFHYHRCHTSRFP